MTTENGKAELASVNLADFELKDIINGHPDRKCIFLLLAKGNQQAVVICDKHAFEEDTALVSGWLKKAQLHFVDSNDRFGNFQMTLPPELNQIKTTFIFPATKFDVEKFSRQEPFFVYETPADYANITLKHLEESDHAKQLKWVYNLLEKKSEAERIVFENEDKHDGFVLAPDLKWDGQTVDSLYLLATVHRRDLRSVRDLTPNELPLLQNIRDQSAKVIKEKWGLARSQLKMYFHYQPTFYHLHVHIVTLKYEAPGWGGTAILLDSAIDNLTNYPDFYRRATLPFIGKQNHALYRKFVEAGRA